MKSLFAWLLIPVFACSVPDKHPATDGGPGDDAPPPDGPVDSSAPDTTITRAPAEFSNASAAVFEFESNDPAATFLCAIDEEAMAPCTSPLTRTLPDGSHGFVVRAVDAAGNGDDTPAEARFTIDTAAPDTTLTSKPPVTDNSVTVRFAFRSAEANVTFECKLDGASFAACASNDQFGPLGDGAHTFSVRAIDRAGNADPSPATYTWTIDTSTPDTQIVTGPGDFTQTTSATFTFVSPDAGGGATFQCSLDGAAFAACTSPITYMNLAERMHSFAVRVRDAVGNVDPTPATRSWTVDLTAPTTTLTGGPTGITPSASAIFTFTSSEADSRFECQLDAAAFAACTSPFTVMMLSQGAHTFAVRAIDQAGHVDGSPATRSWTVDTVAPNVTITAAPAATSGPRISISFMVSEGAPQCSLDNAAFTACTSPVAFNAPAGPHSFRVRATDAAGNTGMDTASWTIACAAPTVAGAAGLLHFDGTGQTQPNAVAGGADAILGDNLTVEAADPAPTTGRFNGGLAFVPAQLDHVTWPAMLGTTTAFTFELWAAPDAAAGARVLLASGDGRAQLRATATSPTTVQFAVAVVSADGMTTWTATSANVTAGQWHHVLASLAEPTLRLWVDGARTQAAGVDLGLGFSLDGIRIGDNYSGSLDEVWLAQTAITADEPALQRYCPL